MRGAVVQVVLGSLIGAFVPSAALALDRDRALGELHHAAWTARDGAPSQIGALAQTTDGYLWISSSRGLFRFDGVHFDEYRPQEGVRLPSHSFELLAASPDGGLWLSFRTGALGFLKDGRITTLPRPEELPPAWITALACDRDGELWAGTLHGLFRRDGTRWAPVGQGLAPSRIRCLFVDRQGGLWVGSDSGVFFLPRGSAELRATGWTEGVVRRLTQAPDGRIWASGDDGVQPVPLEGDSRPGDRSVIFRTATPLGAVFDRNGALWFAAYADGLRRVRFPERLGTLEAYRQRDGLSSDSASDVLEDREGNIWVSTERGIDRFRETRVVAVRVPSGITGFTLLAGENGDVWAGSIGPLLHVRGEDVEVGKIPVGAVSVYRDRDGTVWWGAHGIWRQRGPRLESYPHPGAVWAMFRSASGGLWVSIGDDDDVLHFQDGVFSRRPLPEGLRPRRFSAAHEDASGRIWLGYQDDQVVALDPSGSSRLFTRADGLDIGRIKVIRGRGPHLWFGGELGLALYRDGRFHTIRTAETELGAVSGIVEARNGDLWLNEMRGIVHIASNEVQRLLADPARREAIERLDHRDGLPGAGQMTSTSSTAVEAADGRIWFATDTGLARIDPVPARKNTVPPPLAIRSVVADGKSYDTRFPLRLAPRTDTLQIDYTALSLSVPSRVRFRYELEGLDRGWQDAGTRRTAFYTDPPPGRYRFRVVACNNDGVWNEAGTSLEITIAPAFSQTPAFLGLCAAASLALAYGLYRWRVAEMRARLDLRFRERLAERTRIARDLHDTLLQGVLSATMQLRVASEQVPAESAGKPRLDRVVELLDLVGAEGRNALQGLRSRLSDLDDLENAFSRLRHELDVPEDVVYRVFGEGPPRPLLPVARDGIYRIGREAVVNALRHSRARHVEVEVQFHPDAVTLFVRDDGCGIASDVLREGRGDHWGLPGMRERAEELGAVLHVRTREGAGTEVELRIPSERAVRPGTGDGVVGWRFWRRAVVRRPRVPRR